MPTPEPSWKRRGLCTRYLGCEDTTPKVLRRHQRRRLLDLGHGRKVVGKVESRGRWWIETSLPGFGRVGRRCIHIIYMEVMSLSVICTSRNHTEPYLLVLVTRAINLGRQSCMVIVGTYVLCMVCTYLGRLHATYYYVHTTSYLPRHMPAPCHITTLQVVPRSQYSLDLPAELSKRCHGPRMGVPLRLPTSLPSAPSPTGGYAVMYVDSMICVLDPCCFIRDGPNPPPQSSHLVSGNARD